MGCTSSAQNIVPSNANSPEKNIQVEDTDKKQNEIEGNVAKVLPTCDTLVEPIQLARNNKSFIDSSSIKTEKDIHGNGHLFDDSDNMNNLLKDINHQDKIPSLEDIVDRVVELYVTDNGVDNSQDIPTNDQNNETKTKNTESDKTDHKCSDVSERGPTTGPEDEHIDEAIRSSPTQSESSRATRWEALADIAAELPPLLAMDPTTGQIYSLSK